MKKGTIHYKKLIIVKITMYQIEGYYLTKWIFMHYRGKTHKTKLCVDKKCSGVHC